MSQYNKLSDIQYARFQILPVHLHFGNFWSAGISPCVSISPILYSFIQYANPGGRRGGGGRGISPNFQGGGATVYDAKMDPMGFKI